MRHFIFIIIVLAILTSGCTTTIFNQFRGDARNIKLDGKTEEIQSEIPGYCSGPSVDGGRFVGFGLPTNGFTFFLFYPGISLSGNIVTNTEPPSVDAWLIRTNGYSDWERFVRSGDLEILRSAGGEQLTGRVTVRWNNNSDFNIVVDLSGTNNTTSLCGEFVGYTRTKFDPWSIVAGLGMLFIGD